MGNQGINACCNDSNINRNHEFIHPEMLNRKFGGKSDNSNNPNDKENYNPNHNNQENFRGKQSGMNSDNKLENMQFDGEMHITDRKDNDQIVQHIRTTSMANRSAIDFGRIRELASIVDSAPRINLKVLSSGKLKGHVLKINAQGLEGSERNTKDGYVFIGSKKRNCKKNGKPADIINDFIIPSKDKETQRRHRGRHLQIEYNIDKNIYQIKDLGIGFGAFVRIDFPQELKENHLLNLGESFIIVNLINEKFSFANQSHSTYESKNTKSIGNGNDSGLKLRLKLFGGPSTGEVFYFKPDTEVIKIGRSTNCDVVIEDAVLSKFQAHIYFDQTKQCWFLKDGYQDKRSLNGTWLYLNEEFEVYDGLIFKANQTLFQAQLLN